MLKGAGATIALPLLDAMIPAGTALAQTAAAPATRLGFIYFPHGALRDQWEPRDDGPQPEVPVHPGAARAGARLRDRRQRPAQQGRRGWGAARHHAGDVAELRSPAASATRRPASASTADQIAARHLQKDTTLPSMEICGEPGGMISFRSPTQPLPMEGNPRKVFISMFGQGQTKEERQAILGTTTQPARLRDAKRRPA